MTRNSSAGEGRRADSPDQDMAAVLAALSRRGAQDSPELDQFIARWPGEYFGWMAKGALLGQSGNAPLAMLMFRKALMLAPHEAAILNNMALLANRNGAAAGGGKFADRAVRISPSFAEAWINLGISCAMMGRGDKAEARYRRALQLRRDLPEPWSNLSQLRYQQGRHEEAAHFSAMALILSPGFPEAWNMLANARNDLDQKQEAAAAYLRALAISPMTPQVRSNLSGTLHDLRLTDSAERQGRIAVVLAPGYGRALNSCGTALFAAGRLDEAVLSQQRSSHAAPDFGAAHLGLAQALLFLDAVSDALPSYRRALEADPESSGLHAAIDLAVLSYLADDLPACRAYLKHAKVAFDSAAAEHTYVRVYYRYLTALLDRVVPHKAQGGRPLHVIGESHSLGAKGLRARFDGEMMTCIPHWISGCKQWHLATAVPTRYKRKLLAVLSHLPRESAVVMMIGEIDCRINDGILKLVRRDGMKIEDILKGTIDPYVEFVIRAADRHGHRVTFAGVPCGNARASDDDGDRREQADLIRHFNRRLEERAGLAGCGFVDLRALTDRGDGIASGDRHIDWYHLLPSAIAEGLETFTKVGRR